MRCVVCGHELKPEARQCRNCGSLKKQRRVWDRLNIIKRFNKLELQNQKQAAVIMKLWNEVQLKNEPPKTIKNGDSLGTSEDLIDYILKL